MKKKILFVITKSNWGGAQRYVFDLATSLSQEEFDVAVALGGKGKWREEKGGLARRLEAAGVRTILVKNFMRNIWLVPDIAAFFEILFIFAREKPHVVHLNSSKAGAIGALAGRIMGVRKIIFTSHGLVFDEDRNPLARLVIRMGTWATFLLSHRVIVISQDTLERVRTFPFCKEKVSLVYNGISSPSFLTKEDACRALSIKSSNVTIGTIAELTPNKGLRFLIEAAEILDKKGESFSLHIIGDGVEKMSLQKKIEEKNLQEKVILHGFKKDAAQYLKAFDIFTLTSTKEGLPYVLLEVAHASVPVVGSDIPGIADIVENGSSGILVPPKKSDAIAEALVHYMHNNALRTTHGQALRVRAEGFFSIEKMTREISRLYRS